MLFTDGTGEVNVFDPTALSSGKKPAGRTYTSATPHHGVAIELSDGSLLSTLGTEEKRTGALVLDRNDKEIARNEDCPGVHGEAAAKNEAVAVGCEDGILIYQNGTFTKIDSPDDYGRIGNQAGSDASPVLLGDYKTDPEAELERPTRVSLIDTEKKKLRLVELGTSYSFRSLARGPHGEALVLGTDGALHVIDPDTGKVEKKIPAWAPGRSRWTGSRPGPPCSYAGTSPTSPSPARRRCTPSMSRRGRRSAPSPCPRAPTSCRAPSPDTDRVCALAATARCRGGEGPAGEAHAHPVTAPRAMSIVAEGPRP